MMDKFQEAYNEYSKIGYQMDNLNNQMEQALEKMILAKEDEYVEWFADEFKKGTLSENSIRRALHMFANDVKNIVKR